MRKKNILFLIIFVFNNWVFGQTTSLVSSDSIFGVVNVSVCNMRKVGKFTSSMESQALLGTPIKIRQYNGWYEIQTPDNYSGWVHRKVITPMSSIEIAKWNKADKVIVTSHYGFTRQIASELSQPISDVVGGNRLKYEGEENDYFIVSYPDGRRGYLSKKIAQREDEWRQSLKKDEQSVLQTAFSLMGIPYLWAGMSSKGVDCSGYIRTVFFMHDIILPRDAWQQALVGERISIKSDFSNLLPGDLIFFGKKANGNVEESVAHVGLYVGEKQFIHSMGDVHLSSLEPNDLNYDEMNANRLLYANRILPYVNRVEDINTTLNNDYYKLPMVDDLLLDNR